MKKTIFTLLCLLSLVSFIGAEEATFTQEDRDRLIRLETKVEEGQKATNQRIDDVNKRIDDLRAELKGEIGALRELVYVVIVGIFALIGFVIWDRRSALTPAVRKNKELEAEQERIKTALKEVAISNQDIANALRHAGIL